MNPADAIPTGGSEFQVRAESRTWNRIVMDIPLVRGRSPSPDKNRASGPPPEVIQAVARKTAQRRGRLLP